MEDAIPDDDFIEEDLDTQEEEENDPIEVKIQEEHSKFKEAQAAYQEKVRAARPWSAPPLGSPQPHQQRSHDLATLKESSSSTLGLTSSERSEYVPPERPLVENAIAKGGTPCTYLAPPRPMSADAGKAVHRLSTTSGSRSGYLQNILEDAILDDKGHAVTASSSTSNGSKPPPDTQKKKLQFTTVAAEAVTVKGDDEGGDEVVDLSNLESSLTRALNNLRTVAHRDNTETVPGTAPDLTEDYDEDIYEDEDQDEDPVDLSNLESVLSKTLNSLQTVKYPQDATDKVASKRTIGLWVVKGSDIPEDSFDDETVKGVPTSVASNQESSPQTQGLVAPPSLGLKQATSSTTSINVEESSAPSEIEQKMRSFDTLSEVMDATQLSPAEGPQVVTTDTNSEKPEDSNEALPETSTLDIPLITIPISQPDAAPAAVPPILNAVPLSFQLPVPAPVQVPTSFWPASEVSSLGNSPTQEAAQLSTSLRSTNSSMDDGRLSDKLSDFGDLVHPHAFALQLLAHDLRALPMYQSAVKRTGQAPQALGLGQMGYFGLQGGHPMSAPAQRRPASAKPAALTPKNPNRVSRSGRHSAHAAHRGPAGGSSSGKTTLLASECVKVQAMMQASRALRAPLSIRDEVFAAPPFSGALKMGTVLETQPFFSPQDRPPVPKSMQRPSSARPASYGAKTVLGPSYGRSAVQGQQQQVQVEPLVMRRRPMSAHPTTGDPNMHGSESWYDRGWVPGGGTAVSPPSTSPVVRTAAVEVSGRIVSVYTADTMKRVVEANKYLSALGSSHRYQLKDPNSNMDVVLLSPGPATGDWSGAEDIEELEEDRPPSPQPMKAIKTVPLRQFLITVTRLKAQVSRLESVNVKGTSRPTSRYEIDRDLDDSIAIPESKLFAPTSDGEIRQQLTEATRQCEQLAQRISDLRYS
ncbi:hypothetical protein CEUSTIGMA_g5043.t1 [Chlamydomonas eustigma]|uniref:Uncharacterized protein n=1 Tax=Chlamydomonas eustigma TaxID=1157962 RepID=A0A250X3V5_9CHLO|nr:hypothetical protein CEUSTIGMA_g5043.t1 [Chlamydomonas eustigma]|eukprot:GAX77599.1 hypothetical protein CEUSTIGMA_g5043.t1 [Chlamydomonas eustigma]